MWMKLKVIGMQITVYSNAYFYTMQVFVLDFGEMGIMLRAEENVFSDNAIEDAHKIVINYGEASVHFMFWKDKEGLTFTRFCIIFLGNLKPFFKGIK